MLVLQMRNSGMSQLAQKYYSMLVANRKADAIQTSFYSLYNLYKFRKKKKKLKIHYITDGSDLK